MFTKVEHTYSKQYVYMQNIYTHKKVSAYIVYMVYLYMPNVKM